MFENSTRCFFWPNQPSRCDVIIVLQYVFSSISFICLFSLIVAILAFKLYKLFVQRLILFLCFCSIVNVSTLFSHVNHISASSCRALGFVDQFVTWAELLWVCMITANIYMVYRGHELENHERKVHLFVWLTSLFWSIIPLFGSTYGSAGSWCWIKREYTAMRFGVWYVPLMLIIFGLLCVCAKIACTTHYDSLLPNRSFFEMETSRTLHEYEVRPLLAYPIIYFFLNLPMLIYRIDDAIHPKEVPNYTLLVISVITSPLLGTFNALAFCVIEDTLRDICRFAALKSLFCCTGETSRVVHNYEVVDEDERSVSGQHQSNTQSYNTVS